jgi:hypothetical protein
MAAPPRTWTVALTDQTVRFFAPDVWPSAQALVRALRSLSGRPPHVRRLTGERERSMHCVYLVELHPRVTEAQIQQALESAVPPLLSAEISPDRLQIRVSPALARWFP